MLTLVKIVIGGVVNAHVGVKYIYVHLLRGTKAMYSKSMVSRVKWAAIGIVLWIISWIIAEAIPVFNDVLGLAVSIHQSGSVSRGNSSLTDLTELAVCQLVHLWSAGAVLALHQSASLVHDQDSDDLFLHQHWSGLSRSDHCKFHYSWTLMF
jgi:hypothetical protein